MLKITELSNLALRLGANDDEVVGSGDKVDNKNLSKKSNNIKSRIQTRIGAMEEPTFLTPSTKEAFNQLRQAFTEAPIFQHFDPECHIRIKTNAIGYTIGEDLNQLTSNYLISNQG